MTYIYQEDQVTLNPERISDGKHPIFGETTIFHDVVLASEMVQKYPDGVALKDRKELEDYAWTIEGRWVKIGGHPENGIISDRDEVGGRTINVKFVKNLIDHKKTQRPNRAGIRADLEVFNKKVSPELLDEMKKGTKPDVSIGFFFTKDETKGDFNGEKYDYVQRNMFHDHLAAGIDNGRCPSPYCGLGADELREKLVGDPFAGFSSFEACVAKMMKPKSEGGQGYSEETAKKVCGKLKAQHEDNKEEEDDLVKASRILRALLEEELEALRGEREALKDTREWWMILDWTDPQLAEVFDHLEEDVREQIIDAGLCPTCADEARSEAERAMSHFNISKEEWEKFTPEEKQEYIDKLPPRGSGEEEDMTIDEYEQEYVEADAQWTYAYKASLPDSAYAYIESGCEKKDGKTQQSCRHMPIKDKEGNYEAAHVRAALSALKGGRTGKVPSYASKAKSKVCAGAKALKIESEVCGTEKKKKDALDPYEVLKKSMEVLPRE